MDKQPFYQPHQPQRFFNYYQLKNGLGFMIDGSDHVFKFDRYGGWFDQYRNYYNADGQPDQEPDYSDYEEQEQEWSDGEDEQEDEYEKLYGPNAGYLEEQEEQENQSKETMQKVAKNMAILGEHNEKSMIRVNFQILDRKKGLPEKIEQHIEKAQQKKQESEQDPDNQQEPLPQIAEIVKAYRKKQIDIVTAFYDEDLSQKDSGWIIVPNVKEAEKLISLEGVNLIGFDFTFDVQTLQEWLSDPLKKEEKKRLQFDVKYAAVQKGEKIYAVMADHKGLSCKKQQLKDLFKKLGLKLDLLKIKKGLDGSKIPIIKLREDDGNKLEGQQLNGSKITLSEYGKQEAEDQDKNDLI